MKPVDSVNDSNNNARPTVADLASNDAQVIARHFSQHLQPRVAKTDALRREVYRLRHQVYCEELHFEAEQPDHQELDDFDERAMHCFIRHLRTGQMAGTVRVVTAAQAGELLPIEQHNADAMNHPDYAPKRFPRDSICEISRLAVPLEFRKRSTDRFKGAASGVINIRTYSETELRCFPYIAISLYLAAALLAIHHDKRNAYAMMEPRLARSLSYVGIQFIQLGEPIRFHGRRRAAYYINAEMFRDNLSSGYKQLLYSIEGEMLGGADERLSLRARAGRLMRGVADIARTVHGETSPESYRWA